MRSYLVATGLVFLALIVAHVIRLLAEGPRIALEPLFSVSTLAALGFIVWASRLLASGVGRKGDR